MEWYDKFEKIREFLSDEIIISNVQSYFCSDDLEDFCNQLIIDYDLEDEFKEEDEG